MKRGEMSATPTKGARRRAGGRTHNYPLGVLKNSQNPIKISNFRTFLAILGNIFRLKLLILSVFSANFRFQNNFQTKIIPIFQARFQKFLANMKIILSYFFLYLQSQYGPPEARVHRRTKSVTPPASLMV